MELFLVFLLLCMGMGMFSSVMRWQRQLWIVGSLVLLVTVLYFTFSALIY